MADQPTTVTIQGVEGLIQIGSGTYKNCGQGTFYMTINNEIASVLISHSVSASATNPDTGSWSVSEGSTFTFEESISLTVEAEFSLPLSIVSGSVSLTGSFTTSQAFETITTNTINYTVEPGTTYTL